MKDGRRAALGRSSGIFTVPLSRTGGGVGVDSRMASTYQNISARPLKGDFGHESQRYHETSQVITLPPDMGIVEAAEILMDNNTNGAPVLARVSW